MLFTITQPQPAPNKVWLIENEKDRCGVCFKKTGTPGEYEIDFDNKKTYNMTLLDDGYKEKAVLKAEDDEEIGNIEVKSSKRMQIVLNKKEYQTYKVENLGEARLCFCENGIQVASVKISEETEGLYLYYEVRCALLDDLEFIIPVVICYEESQKENNVRNKFTDWLVDKIRARSKLK